MALVNGEIADADDVNSLFNNIVNVPIGAVIAWFDSIAGVPDLPDNWVACDGQTLDNDLSPIDGQAIPDLNGGNRFLRGNSTAGDTGGLASVTLTAAQSGLRAHGHDFKSQGSTNNGGRGIAYNDYFDNTNLGGPGAIVENTAANASESHENRPPYTNVVWIMRIY